MTNFLQQIRLPTQAVARAPSGFLLSSGTPLRPCEVHLFLSLPFIKSPQLAQPVCLHQCGLAHQTAATSARSIPECQAFITQKAELPLGKNAGRNLNSYFGRPNQEYCHATETL